MRAFRPAVPIVLGVAVLSACASHTATTTGGDAGRSVGIVSGDGRNLGSVIVGERAGVATLEVEGLAMPAGIHGVHLHEKGLCEGPTFVSAGAHLNPAGKQHGRDNPAGAHLGDLPNLTVSASGRASARLSVAAARLAMLADADGTALVVHAEPDDYRTDPSGNSGDRIACAVIAPPR